jgi:hypothetical protein
VLHGDRRGWRRSGILGGHGGAADARCWECRRLLGRWSGRHRLRRLLRRLGHGSGCRRQRRLRGRGRRRRGNGEERRIRHRQGLTDGDRHHRRQGHRRVAHRRGVRGRLPALDRAIGLARTRVGRRRRWRDGMGRRIAGWDRSCRAGCGRFRRHRSMRFARGWRRDLAGGGRRLPSRDDGPRARAAQQHPEQRRGRDAGGTLRGGRGGRDAGQHDGSGEHGDQPGAVRTWLTKNL